MNVCVCVWGFPKIRGTVLGVPIIRTIVYWGPLIRETTIWVVVKIMVLFWIPIIRRHRIFRLSQKGTIILTTTHMRPRP